LYCLVTALAPYLSYLLFIHHPSLIQDEAGGNVGSKATLGDLSGFERGYQGAGTAMVDGAETYDGDKAYKDSKLCNVITCLELAKRLKAKRSKVTTNVMNPGLIPVSSFFISVDVEAFPQRILSD
jgi:NAD(P)-dependent dehydrogenase (short-subunit alcohol dehydrogenase family)